MTTPSDPAPEPSTGTPALAPVPAPPTEDDARRFFRELYAPQTKIPKWKVKKDVDGFESKYGKTPALTTQRLGDIAKEVRRQMRRDRNETENTGDDEEDGDAPSSSNPVTTGKATKWIGRLKVGVYILAAVGLAAHAQELAKAGFSWAALKPYIVGIFTCGVSLWLLETAVKQLQDAAISNTLKNVGISALFLLVFPIVAAAVFWLVVSILRDAGVRLAFIEDGKSVHVGPPKEFVFDKTESYADEDTLPVELFGKLSDENTRPRDWLEELQFGTAGKLGAGQKDGVKQEDVQHWWLITKDQQTGKGFEKGIHEGKARVNVGTDEDVVILAFLVEPGEHTKVFPLKREYNASKFEYTFVVPESQAGDRLLFYIGMMKSTYKKFESAKRNFEIKP